MTPAIVTAWCNVCHHNRKVELVTNQCVTLDHDTSEYLKSATLCCPDGHPVLAIGYRGEAHEPVQSQQ